MKKLLAKIVIVVVLTIVSVYPAIASGGQVRGDNGQGAVNQVQIMNPHPFQP